jgi:hypothetical protein
LTSHDKADLDLIDAKNLRVKKIKDAQPEVLKRADAMTNNRDDRNINLDYTKKNAKDRAARSSRTRSS